MLLFGLMSVIAPKRFGVICFRKGNCVRGLWFVSRKGICRDCGLGFGDGLIGGIV